MADGPCGYQIPFDGGALFGDGTGWTDATTDPINPMSITNRAELQEAVVAWTARPDLATNVNSFITIAESRFNRQLRVQLMESRLVVNVCEPELDLPILFRGVRAFRLDKAPNGRLNYLTPEQFDDHYGSNSSGIPRNYTIINQKFFFGPSPAGSYAGKLYYWRGVQALSESVPTNEMLLRHPDLYLYGSLVATEQYMHNDPRFAVWRAEYDRIIQDIKDEDQRDRVSGSTLAQSRRTRERV